MVEKMCSHCGTTVLVGLEYCPGCLRAVPKPSPAAGAAAKAQVEETWRERARTKLEEFGSRLLPSPAPGANDKDYSRFDRKASGNFVTMAMTEGYTRVVCPSCLRATRTPLDQPLLGTVTCEGCRHEFPGSFAAEFRRGSDLECFQCGVTTFCVQGVKVNRCPNCEMGLKKARDPEVAKILTFVAGAGGLLILGFALAVATQNTSQYLVWLGIGSVCSVVGFITLAALGF